MFSFLQQRFSLRQEEFFMGEPNGTAICTSTSGDPRNGTCTDEDNENQDKGCDEIDFCKDWF